MELAFVDSGGIAIYDAATAALNLNSSRKHPMSRHPSEFSRAISRLARAIVPSSILAWRSKRWRIRQGRKALNKAIFGAYGFWRSLAENSPVDEKGKPIPWYTYPAIHYLDSLDFSHSDVLEWGSGGSSVYWSQRVQSLVSVEHDRAWADRIAPQLRNSQYVVTSDPNEYMNPPGGLFDMIVIDGIWRAACARSAIERLKPAGIIVFDDSNWFPGTCAWLRGQGFTQIDFHGVCPAAWIGSVTSVFLRSQFAPAPRRDALPGRCIGEMTRCHDGDPLLGSPSNNK